MSATGRRRGFAFVDVLMTLGGLAVMASVAYPLLAHRAYQKRVERVIARVEVLRTAATEYRTSTGHWPEGAAPGHVSDDLAKLLPAEVTLRGRDYSLGWTLWKVVEIPPQPVIPTMAPGLPLPQPQSTAAPAPADSVGTRPPVVREMGGITVNSPEDALLGALLKRYGSAMSFVRDSTWTLVMGVDPTF